MKALLLEERRRQRAVDSANPDPRAGEVRLRGRAGGLCGSSPPGSEAVALPTDR